MQINSSSVALTKCWQYQRPEIVKIIDNICTALHFRMSAGTRVLLKPNLLSGRSSDHLACTHAEFTAAVAEWFVDQGAVVEIGDSPALGTAQGVMRTTGINGALAGLPVKQVNFDQMIPVRLAGGVKVNIARAAMECDLLINLPKVKAHSQLFMTLAVKNYFGTVVGFQKPVWHLRYGNVEDSFASHLVDLLAVLPSGVIIVDGIVAMHCTGPVSGKPYSLGLIGGSHNPVAVDTALLETLRLNPTKSAVWRQCAKRGLAGSDANLLDFPFLKPADFQVDGFRTPETLKPVSFNPLRMMVSACRRFTARLKESS